MRISVAYRQDNLKQLTDNCQAPGSVQGQGQGPGKGPVVQV